MNGYKIKKELITKLKDKLNKQLLAYKQEMENAQKEANFHKGAMQSRYDTFKEEAQMLKDGFARQYNEVSKILEELEKFEYNNITLKKKTVTVGSLILLFNNDKEERYFIFPNIPYSVINIDGVDYKCISSNAPFSKALLNKTVGDEIEFRDSIIEIEKIF